MSGEWLPGGHVFAKLKKNSKNFSFPISQEKCVCTEGLHPLSHLFALMMLIPLTHPGKQLGKPGTLEDLLAHHSESNLGLSLQQSPLIQDKNLKQGNFSP